MKEITFEKPAKKEMPAKFEMIAGKAVRDMGIPANIKGYFYLIEAVRIAYHNKRAVLNVTQNIYIPIAEQFFTTKKRVSDAIARAIIIGRERCNLMTLEEYFGSNAFEIPSNSEFITVLAEHVQMAYEKAEAESVAVEHTINMGVDAIREMVVEVLDEMKVPVHLKGYQYLIEAITLTAQDMDLVNALYNVLYLAVANLFDTTPERVANAISYAIEASWDLGDLEVLMSWFGYTMSPWKGKPTNGEFIAMIADTIQRRMERIN